MSNTSNNRINVPEARAAMDRFKMEAAGEVGVNLKNGYNGDLTTRQAGSIGGQMVKNVWPVRSVNFERTSRVRDGHKTVITYAAGLRI